jgi:hypothetical protein
MNEKISWRLPGQALLQVAIRLAARSCVVVFCAGILLLLIVTTLPVSAKSRDCVGLSDPPRKVLFGKPEVEGDTSNAQKSLSDGLIYAFNSTRERGWRENEPVKFVFCNDTDLATDSDLTAAIIQDLYSNKVVLEVRAKIETQTNSGTVATLQYLSIPTLRSANNIGILIRRIGIDPTGNFVDAYTRPNDIDAFVATGLGVRYLDERQYDWAWQNFCIAEADVKSIMAETDDPLGPIQKKSLESLNSFIDTSVAQTVRLGRSQPTGSAIAAAYVDNHNLDADPCFTSGALPQP